MLSEARLIATFGERRLNCQSCGHANAHSHRYCSECGAQLDAATSGAGMRAGERKQVTVMFCDIVGSTPLAARVGADRMHGVVNEFFAAARAEVQRYDGSVNRFLGDGFMALFGAPVAHEDHARRAALAALAIQQTMNNRAWGTLPPGAELQVRIGLNTGAVVFGRVGDDERMEFTAIGDTANVAARLQAEAAPGTVACSESVARALAGFADCRALGARMLKGKAEPVPVYQVLSLRKGGAPQAGAGLPALVGREAELAVIVAAIDRVADGRGGALGLIGDSGLGKSRLLAEAGALATARPLRWSAGACTSFGRTLAYAPFREVLLACLAIAGGEDEAAGDATRRFEEALRPWFPTDAVEVAPYIAALLGIAATGPGAERAHALDGLAMGHQIFMNSLRLFERMAAARPLVVVLEDWHWADHASTELLAHLLPLSARAPILFIVTSRAGPDGAALDRLLAAGKQASPDHQRIVLAPLGATAGRALVTRLLDGGTLPAHLEARLLERAGGNPFYLEELIRTLIATGALARAAGLPAWRVTSRVETIPLPDTIEGVILARIDRLEGGARQLIRAAAVIGRRFPVRLLQAVAGAEVEDSLARLVAAELVGEDAGAAEPVFSFKHPLIQQAAYGSLLEDARRRLHQRVGEEIEGLHAARLEERQAVLAYHFAQAEDWPRAQAYLFKAGEQAGRIAADAEALEHYQATLRAAAAASGAPDRVQRAGLEGRIAEALFRLGRHDVALEHAFSGLAMLGIAFPASGKGIRAAIARKVLARARRRVMRIMSLAPAGVLAADAAHVAATQLFEVIGHIDYYRHPPRFVLGILTMLEHAEARPPSRALAVGVAALGLICDSLGLPRFARKLHARAGRIGEALGDDLALGYCYNLRGLSEYGAGDWRASLATQEMAAARCKAAGHLRLWASSIAGQYFVLRSMGDARWIALMARQQEVAVAIGDAHALAWVTNTQGVAALYRGDAIAADAHFERACEAYEAIPDYRFLAGSLARRAYCRALAGEMDHAFRLIGQCEDLIRRHHIRGIAASAPVLYVAEAYLCAAQSHPDAGERHAALRRAGPACTRAIGHGRRTGDESAAEALRLAGTFAWLSARPERALRNWKRGIAVADRKGANHALAKLHHEIALRTGDAAHAQAAKEWFDKTGSAPVKSPTGRGGVQLQREHPQELEG